MKIAASSACVLGALLSAFAGHWLANHEGWFNGGLCIALSPVLAGIGGFILRDWLGDVAAKLNPLGLLFQKLTGGKGK